MAHEIEIKVHLQVDEVQTLRSRIDRHFPRARSFPIHKMDTYYCKQPGTEALFRVRSDGSGVTVTRKVKEKRTDGVEVNTEIEFHGLPAELQTIDRFFQELGYRPLIEKCKRGTAWIEEDLTMELVEVSGLGWYLEMEVLAPETDDGTLVNQALDRLARLRQQLGVGELPLEGRYYIEMLRNA